MKTDIEFQLYAHFWRNSFINIGRNLLHNDVYYLNQRYSKFLFIYFINSGSNSDLWHYSTIAILNFALVDLAWNFEIDIGRKNVGGLLFLKKIQIIKRVKSNLAEIFLYS